MGPLGAIIVIAQGSEDNFSLGMLLAFGGGIYVQVGVAECMPRASEVAETVMRRLLAVCVFIIGVITIAVVLVSHEHCSPDGGHSHDHAH